MHKIRYAALGVLLYTGIFSSLASADSARKPNLGLVPNPGFTSSDTARMMLEGRMSAPANKPSARFSVSCSDGFGRTYSQNQREFANCVNDSQNSASAPALIQPAPIAQPGTATPGPAVNFNFVGGNS